ncbi:MAG: methyl-accepting chemotaxis protein [Bacteriovorax sp.]|nr:methyl-accepting chemotaxis protein [Bacteriovorax sp.]
MNFFQKTSLKIKLIILTLSLATFTIAAGGAGVFFLKSTVGAYEKVLAKPVPKLSNVKDMLSHYRRLRIYLTLLAIPGISKEYSDDTLKVINESLIKYEATNKAYTALEFVPGQKELYEKLDISWRKYQEVSLKIVSLFNSGKPSDREILTKLILNESSALATEYTANYLALVAFHENVVAVSKLHAQEDADRGNLISMTIAILSFVFALIIGFVFSNYITKILQAIATDLSNSGEQVSSASSQIASASEELSQATTEQAASLQETSSSIEEISSMINANTENAKQSSVVSEESLSMAEKGKEVVDHMLTAIAEINTSNNGIMDQINNTNKEIENIVTIINEIGNKTKVINDIVFQTKLLSFNASVEAARAGDQGKGFAVVAEEVGNLAAMSGAAALEITNMLEGSIKTVEGIVRDSKDKIGKLILNGKEKVETGTRVAHECEEVLNEIVSSVASVSKMVTEIASASQEQAQGVHEITKAVAQLDQVTQQNTANSAESANAAGVLSNQAEMLNSLVQKLAQTIQGGDGIVIRDGSSTNSVRAMNTINAKSKITKVTSSSNSIHKKEQKLDLIKGELPSNSDNRFVDV